MAVRLLGARAHSMMELRRKLIRRGFEAGAVESAVERLRERGYLDDEAYARSLVRRRSMARGPNLIAAELSARGVDHATAAEALREIDRAGQLAAAQRLAAAKPGHDPQRLAASLQRRGFEGAVIREVLTGSRARSMESQQ